jgi:redox-sensitive bicupin YhaK (pirin superfamily)
MIKHIPGKNMGRGRHGWLESWFHFSFADYYNPDNIRFGVLRVFNDDTVQPGAGFPTHPHRNMEIISYVVQGELSHKDSMGNAHTLTRGQSQYMSAGTGVTHSEFNLRNDELRFMQIWILPDKDGYKPNYGDYRFVLEDRFDKWLPIATGYENAENNAPIKVHADVNAYATILSAGNSIELKVGKNRQAYLVLLEGEASVGDIHLETRDALEIVKETIFITAKKAAHFFVLEMEYDDACYKEKYGDEAPLSNGADLR